MKNKITPMSDGRIEYGRLSDEISTIKAGRKRRRRTNRLMADRAVDKPETPHRLALEARRELVMREIASLARGRKVKVDGPLASDVLDAVRAMGGASAGKISREIDVAIRPESIPAEKWPGGKKIVERIFQALGEAGMLVVTTKFRSGQKTEALWFARLPEQEQGERMTA